MHNFKRVLAAFLCVLFFFSGFSYLMIDPYLNSELGNYQDQKVRSQLAGKIDFLVTGASLCVMGFDTRVLDQELGCFSYNLGNFALTGSGRGFFLRKEIERNPVETVVFDVAVDTLCDDETAQYANGDAFSLARLDSPGERIRFIYSCVGFEDWANLYAKVFIPGIEYWTTRLRGETIHAVDYSTKGYITNDFEDASLSPEQARERYNTVNLNSQIIDANVQKLREDIRYCQSKNINVILVKLPKSDRVMWETVPPEDFFRWMDDFSEEMGCPFYNFDLFRDRYQILSDRDGYMDGEHLSTIGAGAFTKAFCEILKKSETEDVSGYFYNSYEEMRADSPYMQYLQ